MEMTLKLQTFTKGGIHPPENKLAKDSPIKDPPLPEKVTIPLSQHIGAPAKPIVKKGDQVKVGTLIAESGGFISANIHSSVSGKVLKIDDVNDPSGYPKKAIFIQVEDDEWEPEIDRSTDVVSDIALSPEEIVERIKTSGIVGLGGATFPTHVKFMVPKDKVVDTLIINAVECEPYLTADHRLMLERPDQILIGVEIMKKALGIQNAFIGIENNKPDAIELLTSKAHNYSGTKVVPLEMKYPQGAEKQLIKAIVNREVPSGRLPMDVGCVVDNVGTTFSIYQAVQHNMPLISRVVTVTGKQVREPSNFQVRVGTPFHHLLDAVGGIPDDTAKIISGGPMMGKAVGFVDIPVAKGTSGILLLGEQDAHRRKPSPCIRCGNCVDVCPMGLEPYLLEKQAEKSFWEDCETHHILDCIECGSCSFICPAARPLLDQIRWGKKCVAELQRKRKQK
jgi:electron transport complex protein RnfC